MGRPGPEVFVLPSADLDLVADALAFGLRLNGGATCIAPRRVFVPQAQAAELSFDEMCPYALSMNREHSVMKKLASARP